MGKTTFKVTKKAENHEVYFVWEVTQGEEDEVLSASCLYGDLELQIKPLHPFSNFFTWVVYVDEGGGMTGEAGTEEGLADTFAIAEEIALELADKDERWRSRCAEAAKLMCEYQPWFDKKALPAVAR